MDSPFSFSLFSSLPCHPSPRFPFQGSSTGFIQSPELACTVCWINLLIGLNNNNSTESIVFWGLASSIVLLKGQMISRSSTKQEVRHEGKGQNCPLQRQWVVKIALAHLITPLSDYSQNPAGIIFNMQIPTWFEQGKVCWNPSTDPHLHCDICSAREFVLWRITSYEFMGTIEEYFHPLCIHCFSGSIGCIFLRKA